MLNPNTVVIEWFNAETKTAVGAIKVAAGFLPPAIPPDVPPTEYIIIRGRVSDQGSGKSCFINQVTIMLDIVVKNSNFGFKRPDEIAQLILNRIDANTVVTLPTGFNAGALSVGIDNLEGLTDETNSFRTILTYNLTVRQTT